MTFIPIGLPFPNYRVFVLHPTTREVQPLGCEGELYIGGVGLARGYHNRPELTADRFVSNPFSSDETARLYRTGDLARFANDGCIEYLGRNDDQIKLRGFRIELGEIEATLREHPGVRTCAVLARAMPSHAVRLEAFVVGVVGVAAAAASEDELGA